MQRGRLDWILDQKKGISGKTGEIQKMFVVNGTESKLISQFDRGIMVNLRW